MDWPANDRDDRDEKETGDIVLRGCSRQERLHHSRFVRRVFTAADDIDVDRTTVVDELVNNRPEDELLPPGTQGLAYDNSCHVMTAGIFDDGRCYVQPEGCGCGGPQFLGKLEGTPELFFSLFGKAVVGRGLDIYGAPCCVHPVGLPAGRADEPLGQGAWADTDQQVLACRPGPGNRPRLHVREHLVVDPLSGPPQGKFPEGIQVAFIEKLLDRGLGHVRNVYLAFPQPLEEFRRRKVHHLDLGSLINHPVGDGLAYEDSGDLGDYIVQTFHMLDIEGCIDIDPRCQQLFDILVPLGMA